MSLALVEFGRAPIQKTRKERIINATAASTARVVMKSPRLMAATERVSTASGMSCTAERILNSTYIEKKVQRALEKRGFVEVEADPQTALTARTDTLKATWALKGLDHMIKNSNRQPEQEERLEHRVKKLSDAYIAKTKGENVRLDALMRRFTEVRERKDMLETVLKAASSEDPTTAAEAKKRLGLVMDIVEDKLEKPNPNGHKAVILTQTAYLLGNEDSTFESHDGNKRSIGNINKFNKFKKLGVELASGSLPYMGAAVLYAELMATNKFSDIEFIDFRDKKAIDAMIARGDREYAFVSGATTFDGEIIDDLNTKLSESGLIVVNGGVAASIDPRPKERYLQRGVSVFIGDVEESAEQLVDNLEKIRSGAKGAQVFIRPGSNRRQELRADDEDVTVIEGVTTRALLHAAYSESREIDEGRLADRLLAMEMMRTNISVGDKSYEQPPSFKFHQTATSYGCPEKCTYCATVPTQGVTMRQRSMASLQREWEATESGSIAIVDQNFVANGRDYVTEVLGLADNLRRRLGFEGELLFFSDPKEKPWENDPRTEPVVVEGLPITLAQFAPTSSPSEVPQHYFFDGTPDDEMRKDLLSRVALGIQVGLEQPIKVKGTVKGGKDPKRYKQAVGMLNEIGVPLFGTFMVGMPEVLYETNEEVDTTIIPTTDKLGTSEWDTMVNAWAEWIDDLGVAGPIVFNFSAIEGTAAYRRLEALDLLQEVEGSPYPRVRGIESEKAFTDIGRKVFSRESINHRLLQGNFTNSRLWKMFFFNLMSQKAFRADMG